MATGALSTKQKLAPESVRVFGVDLRVGHRVRLWPQKTADIIDLALAGKIAVIEAIEQDFDDQIHFAVVLDDDPGRDLGMMRQPGHRFFFSPEEVEPVREGSEEGSEGEVNDLPFWSRVLATSFSGMMPLASRSRRSLAKRKLPENVEVRDFGIRGFDLAYALLDPWDTVILVDALPRGEASRHALYRWSRIWWASEIQRRLIWR